MFEAARLADPIAHTSALAGFLAGAVLGIALIAAVAFATFTCGFGVALLAGLAAGMGAGALLGLGETIGRMFSAPSGALLTGARNVYVNSRLSALATASTAACSKHNPVPVVAEGSTNVFIHGLPAARQGDALTCGAKIDAGSPNTFIGGGRVGYLPVDDEVPAWLRTTVDWSFALAGLVGGLAGLLKAAGGITRAALPCAARFTAGFVLGEAAGRYVIGPAVSRVFGGLFGHPVDVSTGRKLLLASDELDFVLPGALPLACGRFYASNLAHEGALGRGWVLPWEMRLERRQGRLWLVDAQGRETGFPIVPPGQSAYSDVEQKTLACTAGGRYVLVGLDEIYHDFGPLPDEAEGGHEAAAHLQRIEDRCGQWVHLHRGGGDSGSARIDLISSSAGWQVRLSYLHARQRLTQIELHHQGRRETLVQYGYDDAGQLTSVTDANGRVTRRFEYTAGLMTAHTSALGLRCSYEWQTLDGQPRVVRAETSEGEVATFTYDLPARRTWVIDELGRRAGWGYDEHHQVTHCVDLDGSRYGIDYTPSGQPAVLHLPAEPNQTRRVVFEHDAAGRIVAETDPLGRTTRTRYHGLSLRPEEVIQPDGSRWRAEYDALGRLLGTLDPLGRQQRYEYAPADPPPRTGLPCPWPQAHVDAKGGRRRFDWDRRGLLLATTDCSGRTTRHEYDVYGHLSSITDALGQSTRVQRLPDGQPRLIEFADGSWQGFEYDAAGLPVRQNDHAGRQWTWQRNARGQVLQSTDPAGRGRVHGYDPQGRLVRLEALLGGTGTYGFEYDAGDRLVCETRPDGVQRRLRYGAFGQVVSVTLVGADSAARQAPQQPPPQRVTHFERDALGRLLAQTSPTAVTRYTWGAAGQLCKAERQPTAAGRDLGIAADTVELHHDAAGRLVAEVGREGRVAYDLDELDHLAGLTLPHGPRLDWLAYGSGHVHQVRCGEQVIADIERDELHREVQRTQGRLSSRQGYDALGRCTWQSAGPQAERLGPGQGQVWRGYRYSAEGELAVQEDGLRGTLMWQYDAAGQMLKRSQWQPGRGQDSLERFAWDAAGNLIDGIRSDLGQDLQRKSTGRVEGNRLRAWQDLRFEYDAWGNLTGKQRGAQRRQEYRFDGEDRLVAVRTAGPGGGSETRFEYDALGRRIGRTLEQRDDTGRVSRVQARRFVWQGLRMVQEIREGGATSSYVYSPDAAYTPMARVDSCVAEAAAGRAPPMQVLHFHTDALGVPQEVTDDRGELAWAGEYRAWGKVERQVDGADLLPRIDQPLRLPGQYADDSTGLHYNTFRYYDPDIGRFISQDPIGLAGGENLYGYAPNPTGWADPLGLTPVMLDPSLLRFSQSWVSPNDYADVIAQKGWIGDPLNVINRDGKWISFDNRRLDAARSLGMKEVPVNIVNGSDPYPKSTTGKTWNNAFDDRLKNNGLGQHGTAERPAVGRDAGTKRITQNRSNKVGC